MGEGKISVEFIPGNLVTQTKPNYGMHAGYKTEDVVLVPDGFQERLVACAGRRRSLVVIGAPDLQSPGSSQSMLSHTISTLIRIRSAGVLSTSNATTPVGHSDFYSSKLGNHVLLNTTYFSFWLIKEL